MKEKDKKRIRDCISILKMIREVISDVNAPLEGRTSHKLTGCCIKVNTIVTVLETVLQAES